MTDKIENIISQVRVRFSQIREDLENERLTSVSLRNEMESLKSELNLEKDKNKKLGIENDKLKSELISGNEKMNISSGLNTHRRDEIESLVREIEYCINQLKNNG